MLTCTAEFRKQLFSPVGLRRPLLINIDAWGSSRECGRCDSDMLLRGRYPPETGREGEEEEGAWEGEELEGMGEWSLPFHTNFGSWLKKLLAITCDCGVCDNESINFPA